MLVRGTPLSELAARSPLAVIGRVEAAKSDAGEQTVTLAVEQSVLGRVAAGPLRFSTEGHHPPDYRAGQHVLVFLSGATPPFASRQSALDRIELPKSRKDRDALVAAVQAWAGLRNVPDRAHRIAQLKTLSLLNLESPSPRARRESLLDLLALGGGNALDAAGIARVAALASRDDTPPTLGPGLVALLASANRPEATAALDRLVASAPSPQVRTLAAQSLDRRRAATPAATESTASKGRES